MQVIATAGHVDHGKSTLVRALTGMDPDRLDDERRRGMTIDLGYAWTRLASGTDVAFVDVPGHERFATNMLAGVGPVPAALLVIAADGGWAAQTEDHVRALDALGVRHGVLAVTRCDLADARAALDGAKQRLASTSLAGIGAVAVSGTTGEGMERLRAALETMVLALPQPERDARVRFWIDRCFTIRGVGTVVTGTLPAGTIRCDDVLVVNGRSVTVRGLECLGNAVSEVSGVARVAINLRGVARDELRRGDALTTPDAWRLTSEADVRVDASEVPTNLVAHLGAAAVPAVTRVLGGRTGAQGRALSAWVRLRFRSGLPLEFGDRLLLRDPGMRQVIGGALVLDPAPPPLTRRGAARERGAALRANPGVADLAREVDARGVAPVQLLRQIGVEVAQELPPSVVRVGGWFVSRTTWDTWVTRLRELAAQDSRGPLDAGPTRADVITALGLPAAEVLNALLESCDDLETSGGRVRRRGAGLVLRADVVAAVERLAASLRENPFSAPDHAQLARLGLTGRELGAAAAAGVVLRLPGDVVLMPDAVRLAADCLRGLPQPFTMSAARQALKTSRRVAMPLLERLDGLRVTERVDSDLRRVRGQSSVAG